MGRIGVVQFRLQLILDLVVGLQAHGGSLGSRECRDEIHSSLVIDHFCVLFDVGEPHTPRDIHGCITTTSIECHTNSSLLLILY